ncbi:hypothetical protein [Actinopolyspora mortivallis]|nr:hypothetical protein [Actinopolyspora mortivallis]
MFGLAITNAVAREPVTRQTPSELRGVICHPENTLPRNEDSEI